MTDVGDVANVATEYWNLCTPKVIISVIDEDDCSSMNEVALQRISVNLVEAASAAGQRL